MSTCHPVRLELLFTLINNHNNFCDFIYRYDSTTGTFTVPPGGDGFYYFSVYLTTNSIESAYFDVEVNEQRLCSAVGDLNEMTSSGDEIVASCNGIAEMVEDTANTANIYHPQRIMLK